MPASPPPTPLAIAIAAGDMAAAIRALDACLGDAGSGAGPTSPRARAAALANRALCHERLGMHRKAIKVRMWLVGGGCRGRGVGARRAGQGGKRARSFFSLPLLNLLP